MSLHDDTLDRLLHDIKSKSQSLQTGVGLLQGGPAPEKRQQILALMKEAAQDVARYLAELETKMASGAESL